jgi:uncharacterized membrane protein HdeD (DUF308 family)
MTDLNFRGAAGSQYDAMVAVLVKNWWAIALRGVLGILFGLIALFLPGATMLSLVLVFAAYAFVDGIFAIISAVRAARQQERWGVLVLEGLVNIAVAAVAVLWPGITVVAFVFLVAFWAVFTGILELAAGFRLEIDGRGWLIFGGVVSVLYGALLIVTPMIGAVVLTWWLGAYALVFGVSLIVLAFKVRARLDKHHGSVVHAA